MDYIPKLAPLTPRPLLLGYNTRLHTFPYDTLVKPPQRLQIKALTSPGIVCVFLV